jgi:hypothetical protein
MKMSTFNFKEYKYITIPNKNTPVALDIRLKNINVLNEHC